MSGFSFRDLTTIEEFAAVVDLERAIWGPEYHDVVPVPMFAISAKRGGILLGAFDGRRMVGFLYSLPALKEGRPTHWSHMLGVLADYRRRGLGCQLKRLQRDRALVLGLDLVEWTFDPLQAANAHLNFVRLGVTVREYVVNLYGASTSVLHRGIPTDRFVAEWWIRTPAVEERLRSLEPKPRWGPEESVPSVNEVVQTGQWAECRGVDLAADAPRLQVEIPARFTAMLADAPESAMAWRLATRQIFQAYLGRGYRVADFRRDRRHGCGAYLLACE